MTLLVTHINSDRNLQQRERNRKVAKDCSNGPMSTDKTASYRATGHIASTRRRTRVKGTLGAR